LFVWAAIYLPGLGSLEIKGEEGRRILPAVTMLQTGNYLVPYVGSEPYFRKPPLVNGLQPLRSSSQDFARNGRRGFLQRWRFSRLRSRLFTRGRRALGTTGSLLAALIWLVNAGNMEKGRLIEIEAIYVSLTALAFHLLDCGVSGGEDRERNSGCFPAIFLGLGMLAKGPLPHLLFFYGPGHRVLWNDRKLSLLATREHGTALIIMFGMFVAWALPAFLLSDWGRVAHVWSRQYTGRVSGSGFQFSSWILNIPRGLVYFLPWLPLALLQFDQPVELRRRHYALLIGIAVPFVLVNLIPGALPRFAMPALGPAIVVVGRVIGTRTICAGRSGSPAKHSRHACETGLRSFLSSLGCIWGLAYGLIATPFLRKHEKVRQHARQIDAIVPTNIPLYAVNPKYQPYLFYVRAPLRYVSTIEQLPSDTKFFLVQGADEEEAQTTKHWSPSRAQMVLRIKDYREHEEVLFSVPSPR
jgi:4-amino-4-deoxy-L-arabinose transferase-like glycosyltransferase